MAEEMLLEMQVTKESDTADHDLEEESSCKDDEETTNETVIQVVRPARDQDLAIQLPLVPPGEAASSRGYAQKYRRQWEQEPMFADWLMPVPGDPYSAACRSCQTTLCAHRKLLVLHCTSQKHLQRLGSALDAGYTPERRISRNRGRARVIRPPRAPAAPAVPPEPPRSAALLADSLEEAEACLDEADAVAFSDPSRLTYCPPLTGVRRVGFIGASCQTQVVARGMLDRGLVLSHQILVSAPDQLDLDVWRSWSCQVLGDSSYDQVFSQCDLVFLAVSYDQLDSVIDSLSPEAVFSSGDGELGQCVVSMVAGLGRDRVSELLARRLSVLGGRRCDVVRAVVNAGVMVGDGCILLSCRPQLPSAWLLTLHELFSALGACQQVEEGLLDGLGAACDSGTAFALSFIEALAAGAVNVGVSWPLARALAVQTTLGAARLLVETGRTAAQLRDEISPPGGATIAGQMALEQHGLRHAVMMAVEAATQRSRHLAAARKPGLPSSDSSGSV